VFGNYKLGVSQLHPNGWIILSSFEKFCRFVRLEPRLMVSETITNWLLALILAIIYIGFFPSLIDPLEPCRGHCRGS